MLSWFSKGTGNKMTDADCGLTRLYGYVRRTGTTQGLEGIIVTATTPDGQYHDSTSSGENGLYAIHFPRGSGNWTLHFKDPRGTYGTTETGALILHIEEQQQNVVFLSSLADGDAG